jgi:hypothetical protein
MCSLLSVDAVAARNELLFMYELFTLSFCHIIYCSYSNSTRTCAENHPVCFLRGLWAVHLLVNAIVWCRCCRWCTTEFCQHNKGIIDAFNVFCKEKPNLLKYVHAFRTYTVNPLVDKCTNSRNPRELHYKSTQLTYDIFVYSHVKRISYQ